MFSLKPSPSDVYYLSICFLFAYGYNFFQWMFLINYFQLVSRSQGCKYYFDRMKQVCKISVKRGFWKYRSFSLDSQLVVIFLILWL